MWINQDAYFSLGKFKSGTGTDYKIQHKGNGAYVFVIEGEIDIHGNKIGKRDAIGIWETEMFSMTVAKDAEILVIDVPMN